MTYFVPGYIEARQRAEPTIPYAGTIAVIHGSTVPERVIIIGAVMHIVIQHPIQIIPTAAVPDRLPVIVHCLGTPWGICGGRSGPGGGSLSGTASVGIIWM